MVNYYGQQAEDYVLWSLFPNKRSGFFVDVGAFDGSQYSNTLSFEEQGWTGICIEAHPDYLKYLRKNRPNSIIVHAAVADQDKDSTTFYANECGVFSSLDRSTEAHFRKKFPKYFTGYTPIEVPMCTINTVLERHSISSVDLVSIDIEGTELTALKGFDLIKYKPRVLVIEAMGQARKNNLIKYLKRFGYMLAREHSGNYFFCHNIQDAKMVKEVKPRNARNNLIHTKHPLKRYR